VEAPFFAEVIYLNHLDRHVYGDNKIPWKW
jgi:hypothetical protein